MKNKIRFALISIAALLCSITPAFAQGTQNYSDISRGAGVFVASQYSFWRVPILTGFTGTGTQTMTLASPNVLLPDGRNIIPFNVGSPLLVGVGSTQETVTPTAVSCSFNGSCTVTGSFSNAHGQSELVMSGDNGVSAAALDANQSGGGVVVCDSSCRATPVQIGAVLPFGNVTMIDSRGGGNVYYTPHATVTTVIAAPATLTATTVGFALNGAAATGGFYNGASTYHVDIACVDVLGNESQPSADFSGLTAGTGTVNQIGFSAPAAQTGCVGWVPLISLAGGTYALSYRVPVATYTNGVATSNGVCVGGLTTIETVTAACKITNATYGQVGSAAVVSALTLATSRIANGIGATSSTADVVGNSDARQTYAYASSGQSSLQIPGIDRAPLTFTAAVAPATAVPAIIATLPIPPGWMNQVGKAFRVCGSNIGGGGSTATVTSFKVYWNADGSNTTGAGVLLPGPTLTSTLSATPGFTWCQVYQTTVAGAGATAGSIQATTGFMTVSNGAAGVAGVTAPTQPGAAVASLNLAQEARIDVDFLHTTGTDGTEQAVGVTIEAVN